MRHRLTSLTVAAFLLHTSIVQAGPTFYPDRAAFLAAVGPSVTDGYTGYGTAPGVTVQLTDAAMSAVLGEASYQSLPSADRNSVGDIFIRGDKSNYCAGCNGNFRLGFGSTSFSSTGGVFGVGIDIVLHTSRYVSIGGDDPGNPTYPGGVLIEFTDGTNELIWIPADIGYYEASTYFLGISDERGIASITIGTEMSRPHFWVIDNLTLAARPELARLTLQNSLVAGCLSVTGTVSLAEPAPSGGVSVVLTDTLASASVPTTLKVRKGATFGRFTITTTPVTTTEEGSVSATFGATTLTQGLSVRPIGISSVILKPSKVTGGKAVNGSANLECAAGPGAILVELSSNNTDVANPTVSSISIPAGLRSGSFVVTTNPVIARTAVGITATANGVPNSGVLTVSP